ncbi:hypothetical protein HAZT_HAZT011505 [Hyalella azteca]|uniref:Uncharacterized protein n=1 Tax=Hyalella azteca TaxID=294128 RepID=A0A6A0GPF4_HYAAZ|nr:hypothetical protein HAZT_HAZT011505 [Hyalella azteca]
MQRHSQSSGSGSVNVTVYVSGRRTSIGCITQKYAAIIARNIMVSYFSRHPVRDAKLKMTPVVALKFLTPEQCKKIIQKSRQKVLHPVVVVSDDEIEILDPPEKSQPPRVVLKPRGVINTPADLNPYLGQQKRALGSTLPSGSNVAIPGPYSKTVKPISENLKSSETIKTSSESLNPSSETMNPSSETLNPSSEILSPSATLNPTSETLNPSSETLSPSVTLNPTSATPNPTSETLNPSSETLNPSQTLNPSSETLKPSSETLNPPSETLNPSPKGPKAPSFRLKPLSSLIDPSINLEAPVPAPPINIDDDSPVEVPSAADSADALLRDLLISAGSYQQPLRAYQAPRDPSQLQGLLQQPGPSQGPVSRRPRPRLFGPLRLANTRPTTVNWVNNSCHHIVKPPTTSTRTTTTTTTSSSAISRSPASRSPFSHWGASSTSGGGGQAQKKSLKKAAHLDDSIGPDGYPGLHLLIAFS